jgi:hypothetical protein
MKIKSANPSECANALLATLILGSILLTVMVVYLNLLQSQNKLVVHSETWNASLTMAEAGIEEAMAQMNNGSTDYSLNGWGSTGSGTNAIYGPVSHNLSGGSYKVFITGVATSTATIYSTGSITVPITSELVSRAVKCVTIIQTTGNIGVGAKGNIDFNGHGPIVDSYDSGSTNLSNHGAYDASKATNNAVIASMGGIVDFGQHTVDGSLYLGPNASYDGSGTVTGTIYQDANINFPDVTLPTPPGGTWQTAPLSGSTHTFTTSGYYAVADQYPIVVNAGVTVTLDVTSSVGNYAPSSVVIHGGDTNSGTANIYLNGPTSMSIAGNTAVDASSRPENLNFYGLPSLASVTMSGSSSFVGTVYAPEASMTLNGGGSSNDFMGSLVVNTLTINGQYNFHYDQSLAGKGIPYVVINSWQEL